MENTLTVAQPAQTPASTAYSADLQQLVDWVDEAESASDAARSLAEKCRQYFHNKQWTAEERQKLNERGQPEIIENRIRRKIKFMLGWERTTRSDPRAYPRNMGTDDEAAEAVTEAIRFQERASRLDHLLSTVWFDIIVPGYGGLEILGPSRHDPRVIEVKLWRWDRLGHDPHSTAEDFSDARYVYGITWLDEADAVARYPNAKAIIEGTVGDEISSSSRTYDDKPRHNAWGARGNRKRVKIAQMYYKDPQEEWHWCIFTKGGKIDGGKVELTDAQGRSHCPLLMQSAYVDEENRRYGEAVEMLTLQDEINKRRSKSLHLLMSNKSIGEQGAVLDVDKFKREMAKPNGHGELAPGSLADKRFQFLDNSAEMKGHFEMLQDARSAFDLIGANATLQGKQEGVASGRAIRASQEGGLIELTDIKDNFTAFKRRVYETLWARVKQFWNEEIWISVTDDERKTRYVGFNREVTEYDELMADAEASGLDPEQAKQQIRQAIESGQINPATLDVVVRTENVPTEIDVDIIIDPAEESVTLQEESFQALANMFPPGTLPPDIVLELWPGSTKIKDKVRKRLQDMQQVPPEQIEKQQLSDQLQADNLAADTEQKRATANKATIDAQANLIKAMTPPALPRSSSPPPN